MRSRPEVTVHYQPAIVRPGDQVTVDVDLRALDPEETLPLFDEMASVAAALPGRFVGPYR